MSIITSFFEHQLTVKMFHFQTKKYGAHKAADAYLIKFEANLDLFMEVWQGTWGRIDDEDIEMSFKTRTDSDIDNHLELMVKYLSGLHSVTPQLLGIRDTMIVDIQQFRYLLTFD